MKRKSSTLPILSMLCVITVMAAFILNAATVSALESVVRLGGHSRIDTAISISDEGWSASGAENVIITNGYSYPDAMAGAPLAALLDAPILLTKGDMPEASILAQLEKLSAKNIYILGGELTVSAQFSSELIAAGYTVERICGSTRYATAAAIANYMKDQLGASPSEIFIASGINFPDALSVSAAAGVLGQPILYVNAQGQLNDESLAVISNSDITSAVVLGGELAVPETVLSVLAEAGLSNVQRLSGSDRYQTSLAINSHYNDILSGTDIAVASGENFPDALAGGAFAAKNAIPVVLINNTRSIAGAYEYITERNADTAYILGLEGALSEYAVNTFLAGGTITTTTTTTTTAAATTTKTTTASTSSGQKLTTNGGSVNVRTGAGTSYTKIGTISSGSYYNVTGSAKSDSGQIWYKILYNGQEGYVSGNLVTVTNGTNTSTKKAYLTFDDGPSKNTDRILDILDQYNVKATFFVIYRAGYESTYKEIVERGHTIALHSYTHDYSTIYRSTTAYFNDLQKLSDYVENLTGVRSKIIRFPGGGSNTVSRSYCRGIMTTLTREVQSRGYQYYDWNVDSGDASANRVSESTIIANIKRYCGSQKSAIILMHDSPAKSTTADALPEIIQYLRSKGYELLPITEDTPPIHHAVNN